jgi:hypothetical protein
VRDDPPRIDPRADRRVAFRKPDLPGLLDVVTTPAQPKLVPQTEPRGFDRPVGLKIVSWSSLVLPEFAAEITHRALMKPRRACLQE